MQTIPRLPPNKTLQPTIGAWRFRLFAGRFLHRSRLSVEALGDFANLTPGDETLEHRNFRPKEIAVVPPANGSGLPTPVGDTLLVIVRRSSASAGRS